MMYRIKLLVVYGICLMVNKEGNPKIYLSSNFVVF